MRAYHYMVTAVVRSLVRTVVLGRAPVIVHML